MASEDYQPIVRIFPAKSVAVVTNATTKPAGKSKKPSEESKPKNPADALKRRRSGPTLPPYDEMIIAAIGNLKEMTGSSHYAIGKFIEEKYKDLLPGNFRKQLLFRLKKLVSNEKLVRVQNSFKLPPKRVRPSKALASDGAGKPAAGKGKPEAKPQPKKQPLLRIADV